MKRSVEFGRARAGTLPVSGQVVVATTFVHPDRGQVSCPGAVLLGGELRRAGVAVEFADWTLAGNDPRARGTGWAMSYVERDGTVHGLAAAAPAGDGHLDDVVAETLGEWTRMLRTRRVVWSGTRPWCSGLVTALRVLDQLLIGKERLFVLGAPPPPPAAAGLARRGAVFVSRVEDVPDGARVVIGPAGVGLAERAELAARGMDVTDATCSVVAAAGRQARTFAEQGESVVLVADPNHAAVPGLVGQAPEQITLAASHAQLATVEVADPGRVAVMVEPGAPLTRTIPVAEAVRARFGHAIPQHPASMCHEPSDRVAAVRRLATETDVVLVAGPVCADGRELVEVIEDTGTRCHLIATPADVEPGWLRAAASVGITASLFAETGLVEQITTALNGLGPTTVAAMATDTVPVTMRASAEPTHV